MDQLQLVDRLVSTVHARLKFSPELKEWYERFHVMMEALFRLELEKIGVPLNEINMKYLVNSGKFPAKIDNHLYYHDPVLILKKNRPDVGILIFKCNFTSTLKIT